MSKSHTPFALLAIALLPACRGGEPGAQPVGFDGSGGGGVVDATQLNCPAPDALPFEVEASGFSTDDAAAIADENPRNKDEAGDILGNPGGVFGFTNMPLMQAPAAGPLVFQGKKARAPESSGLASNPIGEEPVSLWRYDASAESWNQLERGDTDLFGEYRFELDITIDDATRPIYGVLEADRTCAAHYGFLLDAGSKVVITDIDGTLTFSDEELFKQIDDGAYTPLENMSAALLMNTWADKGYRVVYLTARPHAFRAETRRWLDELGYPLGAVISANSLVFGDSARQYKREWVNRIVDDFGWDVVAAYGNAESDIDAYEDAGIDKSVTFIVGPNAGVADTIGIENNDYSAHITDFVEQQPDA